MAPLRACTALAPFAPPERAACVTEPALAPLTGAAAVLGAALGAALAWGAMRGGSEAVEAVVATPWHAPPLVCPPLRHMRRPRAPHV